MLGRPSSCNIPLDSSSSSNSTPLSTEDAELVAVNAAIEEALTDNVSKYLRLDEQEPEVRAEMLRKEKEEDDEVCAGECNR